METNFLAVFIGIIIALALVFIIVFVAFLKSRSLINSLNDKNRVISDKYVLLNLITNDCRDRNDGEVIICIKRLPIVELFQFHDKIASYCIKMFSNFSICDIGDYFYKLQNLQKSDSKKGDYLIRIFEEAIWRTPAEYLAIIFVQNIESETRLMNYSSINSDLGVRGQEVVSKIILNQGNASGKAILFGKEFDKGISALLENNATNDDLKKLIEAESVKFHKRFGC